MPYLCVIEWFDIDENEGMIERKIFGPFVSQEESAKFGEKYLMIEQTSEELECSVGWSTEPLLSSKEGT